MPRRIQILVAAICLVASVNASAIGGCITISPALDAYYDHFDNLIVDDHELTVSNHPTDRRSTMLEFTLPALLNGATINSAFLNIDWRGAGGGTATWDIHSYVGDNAITVADFTPSGSVIGTTSQASPGSDIALNITTTLQGYATGGTTMAGFLIRAPNTVASGELHSAFNSSTPNFPFDFTPNLKIDFTAAAAVPEPSSVLVLLLTFCGFAARRRVSDGQRESVEGW